MSALAKYNEAVIADMNRNFDFIEELKVELLYLLIRGVYAFKVRTVSRCSFLLFCFFLGSNEIHSYRVSLSSFCLTVGV